MKIISARWFVKSFFPLILIASSCSQHAPRNINRSFYYWKSVYEPGTYEKNNLSKLQVSSLYIKFFDVIWNNKTKTATPAAQIKFKDTSYTSLNIVPVIFITNETLINIDSANINSLSENIFALLTKIVTVYKVHNIHEVQFDCDWTASTKDKYFKLLNLLRSQLSKHNFSAVKISATIRLYQCKYLVKTGVPPTDKGMLMCYNMGNLKNSKTENSILESNELKKYISSLPEYPLQLDIALPLFEWKVLFRNNTYTGLIKDLPDSLLQHNASVTVHKNAYTFSKDAFIDNYSFKAGDMLRSEQSSYDEIIKVESIISSKLKTRNIHVILYHLDSLTLSKYTADELENIFDCMR
jgi:hypothetical protein